MKKLIFILFLANLTTGFSQYNPFLNLKYNKVVVYDFLGGNETDVSIITPSGELSRTVSKRAELPQESIRKLSHKLGEKSSYGKATASCFEPHLGIVYYLEGEVVAHVSVCLQCNRLKSSLNIPAQNQGKTGSGKAVYYTLDGMSDSFRTFLNGIVKQYQFSHPMK